MANEQAPKACLACGLTAAPAAEMAGLCISIVAMLTRVAEGGPLNARQRVELALAVATVAGFGQLFEQEAQRTANGAPWPPDSSARTH